MKRLSYIQYIKNHKNSKGELAPWVIKDHETGKILSSHKTKEEAEKHLKRMQMFKHLKSIVLNLLTKKALALGDINVQIIEVERDLLNKLIDEGLLDEVILSKLIYQHPELFEELRNRVVQYLEKEITERDLYNFMKEVISKVSDRSSYDKDNSRV
jgi:hypothetical protein